MYIDDSKAFDTVKHEELWKTMSEFGISNHSMAN